MFVCSDLMPEKNVKAARYLDRQEKLIRMNASHF